MSINRKPEVELVDNLNKLGNKLYKNNELFNFKFKFFNYLGIDFINGVEITADDGKKCLITREFEFNLPKELKLDDEEDNFKKTEIIFRNFE